MKTLVLAVIFLFCLNLAQASDRTHKKSRFNPFLIQSGGEHSHKKRSRVGRAPIVYQGEKPYKPSFGRKKTTKKFMFAGEGMHPDKRFR